MNTVNDNKGIATVKASTTLEELKARIAQLEQEKAEREASRITKIAVSEKGAVSVYGLGRFPVTLYGEQWNTLLDGGPQIKRFIEANKAKLSTRADRDAKRAAAKAAAVSVAVSTVADASQNTPQAATAAA